MKSTDLKVGSKVQGYYFSCTATVTEVTEKQIIFKIDNPPSRISNYNYKLSKKVLRMSIKNVQKMLNITDEYKWSIV